MHLVVKVVKTYLLNYLYFKLNFYLLLGMAKTIFSSSVRQFVNEKWRRSYANWGFGADWTLSFCFEVGCCLIGKNTGFFPVYRDGFGLGCFHWKSTIASNKNKTCSFEKASKQNILMLLDIVNNGRFSRMKRLFILTAMISMLFLFSLVLIPLHAQTG